MQNRLGKKNLKVIFTSIEGVLFSNNGKAIIGPGLESTIDSECMQNLNHICEVTGAKVVITSVWRYNRTVLALQSIFNKAGFTGQIIGKTYNSGLGKSYEINTWLDHNQDAGAYVILDHDIVDESMITQVKTGFLDGGLTKEKALDAIRIINME